MIRLRLEGQLFLLNLFLLLFHRLEFLLFDPLYVRVQKDVDYRCIRPPSLRFNNLSRLLKNFRSERQVFVVVPTLEFFEGFLQLNPIESKMLKMWLEQRLFALSKIEYSKLIEAGILTALRLEFGLLIVGKHRNLRRRLPHPRDA